MSDNYSVYVCKTPQTVPLEAMEFLETNEVSFQKILSPLFGLYLDTYTNIFAKHGLIRDLTDPNIRAIIFIASVQ